MRGDIAKSKKDQICHIPQAGNLAIVRRAYSDYSTPAATDAGLYLGCIPIHRDVTTSNIEHRPRRFTDFPLLYP